MIKTHFDRLDSRPKTTQRRIHEFIVLPTEIILTEMPEETKMKTKTEHPELWNNIK
jgi:hypothetical protein